MGIFQKIYFPDENDYFLTFFLWKISWQVWFRPIQSVLMREWESISTAKKVTARSSLSNRFQLADYQIAAENPLIKIYLTSVPISNGCIHSDDILCFITPGNMPSSLTHKCLPQNITNIVLDQLYDNIFSRQTSENIESAILIVL